MIKCKILGHTFKQKKNSPIKRCEICHAEYYPAHDMILPGHIILELEEKTGD